MLRRYRLEIIAAIAVLAFCALFLYTSSLLGGAFAGTDTVASSRVAEISGIPEEEIQPLVWQWVPPGSGIESALFALQAAVGGLVVGWCFGYWKGQQGRERERN